MNKRLGIPGWMLALSAIAAACTPGPLAPASEEGKTFGPEPTTSIAPTATLGRPTASPTAPEAPTPSPTPPISAVFPIPSDLPVDTVDALPVIGMNPDIPVDGYSLPNSFGFILGGPERGLNFAYGLAVPLESSSSAQFDRLVEQTETVAALFLEGFGALEPSPREPLDAATPPGEQHAGFTRKIIIKEFLLSVRANEMCFSRDGFFVYVLEIHPRTEAALVTVEDLAQLIDGRIRDLR